MKTIEQSAGKTQSLAYVIGVYLGDGWMGHVKSRNGWDFRLNTIDLDFAVETQKAIFDLTGNKGHICTYPVKKSSKPNHSFLAGAKELFWIPPATQGKQFFPDIVWRWDRKTKLEFLSGLLDSEGYVAISKAHPNSITIGLKATNRWMVELYKMCQDLGVKIGKIGTEVLPSGKIAARFHFNPISFIENGCYFKITRKQERINNWIGNPQRLYAKH